MAPAYTIVEFGKAAPAADLAFLHEQLLPRSPVVKLGRRFMEKVYYRALPDEGLIFGYIAYVDGEPVGFTCATEDMAGFLREAFRRRPLQIAAGLLRALAASPRRAAALWEGSRIVSARNSAPLPGPEAELLTTGVLPEYITPSSFKESRLRIGEDLLQSIMDEMRRRGVKRACTIIDQDNGLSRSFVQRHGWRLDAEDVPGWKHRSVAFVWSPGVS